MKLSAKEMLFLLQKISLKHKSGAIFLCVYNIALVTKRERLSELDVRSW